MKKILSLLCVTSSMFAMQLDIVHSENRVNKFQEKLFTHIDNESKVRIAPSSVFVPHQLGSVELYHGKNGFSVRQDDTKHRIKKYFTDPMVRNVNKEQLKAFLKAGYLSLNQMNDGEFSLKAKGRLNGGGPVLGIAAYWTTKCLCYGVLAAGVTASIGGAGLAIGAGGVVTSSNKERIINAAQDVSANVVNLGLSGLAATATVPLVTSGVTTSTVIVAGSSGGAGVALLPLMSTGKIVSTVAMGAGHNYVAGLVATAITGAGLGKEAALVSAAGISTTAGTSLGVVGTIEAISLKIGLFFGMTPTP